MEYYTYILANNTDVAIYIGVTNDIIRRVWEHKNSVDKKSFTAKYGICKLVYYEIFNDPYEAITREKQLKSWNRKRKNKIISEFNPNWKDLYNDILE